MQTTVNDVMPAAFEGMIADSMHATDFVSRKAQPSASPYIPFGKMVVWNTADTADLALVRLPAAAADIARGRLQGIAIAETSKQLDPAIAWGHYKAGEVISVMRKGRIWVISESAVTALDNGVFVRHTDPGVTPPLASLGSFRTDADTADATAMPAGTAQWLTTCSAGGLALLQIDLP
jgi:hypothetical protein